MKSIENSRHRSEAIDIEVMLLTLNKCMDYETIVR